MTNTVDDRLPISLSDLKRRGFLHHSRSGVFDWSNGYNVLGSVRVAFRINVDEPNVGSLTIDYQRGGRNVQQMIDLVRRPSNLGRGGIWYYICPATAIRCRVLLYSPSGFVSRHAEGGISYRSQLTSRKERSTSSSYQAEIKHIEQRSQAIEWMSNPHCKRTYGGKPTRLMQLFRKLNVLPV